MARSRLSAYWTIALWSKASCGDLVGDEPLDVVTVHRQGDLVGADQRPVDDRDDSLRGAIGLAERVELLEVLRGESGGPLQGATGAGGQVLVGLQRSARQCPATLVRLSDAPDERQPKRLLTRLGCGRRAKITVDTASSMPCSCMVATFW